MSDATPIIIPDNEIRVAGSVAEIASDVSSAARTALDFVKKTWVDDPESGTPITAADLNRIEDAISSLDTSVQDLQDSVSRKYTLKARPGRVDHTISFGWETATSGYGLAVYTDDQRVAFIPMGFEG